MGILGIYASAITGNLVKNPPVSGYKMWFDAADTSTITKSGTAVSSVSNKGSLGNAFSTSTTAWKPVSGVTTKNGKNVIDWNANASLLYSGAAADFAFMSNNTGGTSFAVFNIGTVSDNFIFATNEGTRSQTGVQYYVNASSNASHEITRGVSGTSAVTNNSTGGLIGTGWTYLTLISDPVQATAANRSDQRIKQGTAIKNNTQTNAVSGSNPTAKMCIGDYVPGGGLGMIGSIAEIIIYQGILSASDILSTQQYLASKWAI